MANEIEELKISSESVLHEQLEAQKQSFFVEKITDYMSQQITLLNNSKSMNSGSSSEDGISVNLQKLTDIQKKLGNLKDQLGCFVDGKDSQSLQQTKSMISEILKKYEIFILDLTNLLAEKLVNLEKIVFHIEAEVKESEQQKLLLKEMRNLFISEIDELEKTLKALKIPKFDNVS